MGAARARPPLDPRRRGMLICPLGASLALVVADEPKDDISAACLEIALAVVPSKALFRLLEELEISVWDAANPSAFPVLDLHELRRHAHRRHADDDVETSSVADDCSDFEHGRMGTPTGCTTALSATRPSGPIPRLTRLRSTSRVGRSASLMQGARSTRDQSRTLMRTSPRGYVRFETSRLTLYGRPSAATANQDSLGRRRKALASLRNARATVIPRGVEKDQRGWALSHAPGRTNN